jgi:hypothetical protein
VGLAPGRGVPGRGVGRDSEPEWPLGSGSGTAAYAADGEGNATRDLQLVHVRNLAPTGSSDSWTRLMFPHVVQVASIT